MLGRTSPRVAPTIAVLVPGRLIGDRAEFLLVSALPATTPRRSYSSRDLNSRAL